jgi:formylglycine-generating enzyme required for sulfatase activity
MNALRSLASVLLAMAELFAVGPSKCLADTAQASLKIASKYVDWKVVPAGRFMMGGQVAADQVAADFAQYGRSASYFADEFPQHLVVISRPLAVTETEITVGQFNRFVEETGYQTEAERDGLGGWGYDKQIGKCIGRDPRYSWRDTGYPQADDFPVVNVSWNDCQEFCKWLSQRDNRVVRLPTEAEWEYMCRAGSSGYYWMGNGPEAFLKGARGLAPDPTSIRYAVQNLQIAEDSSVTFPVPVKSYPANAFGLYDTHGNVWEWTADWYDEGYYARSPLIDPPGPLQGVEKVRRGGGWNSFPLWARASFRNWNSIDSRCLNLGFRVVAELGSQEAEAFERQRPVRIQFVGDIMLDGGPGHQVRHGLDPFRHCARQLQDCHLSVGNLECVLGQAGDQELKNYTFRAANGSERFLKNYFHALSLGNNHTMDFGADGLEECMRRLHQSDIGFFGAGKNLELARSGFMAQRMGRKILLLGYNGFRSENYAAGENTAGVAPLDDDMIIQDIRNAKAQGIDIVIPYVHWGSELVGMPSLGQRVQARRWIDAGATAVVGAHPHVTQTVELHKGAPIIYSLGNFVFDYFPVDPDQWTGWMACLSVKPDGTTDLEMIQVQLDSAGIPSPVTVD